MHKNHLKRGCYYLLYGVLFLHALLPFWLLYLLSDLLYSVAYYLVRYRRGVVRRNLTNAFPEKSIREIVTIEKAFYHHLSDYIVETIKLLHLSDREAARRMRFENPELIDQLISEGNSCLICMGHYANWEWITSLGMYLHPETKQGLIYKRLNAAAFDQLFVKIRSRFGSLPIEMNSAFRKMIRLHREGESMAVGFLADQRPPRALDHYWTRFLNQDTLVQTGVERIARHLGLSVVYLDMTKVGRGHYLGRFDLITDDAGREPEDAVLEQYMRKLEETILKDPAYYLWSHNRWKFRKMGAVSASPNNDKKGEG